MHLLFYDVRYSPDVSSNVGYFLFFVADVKHGLYGKKTKTTEQMLHIERDQSKNVPRPKRCWIGEVQDLDLY